MSERANERKEDAAVDATPVRGAPQLVPQANLVQAVGRGNPAEVAAYVAANPHQADAVLSFIQRTIGNHFASAVLQAANTKDTKVALDGKGGASIENTVTKKSGDGATETQTRGVAIGNGKLDAHASDSMRDANGATRENSRSVSGGADGVAMSSHVGATTANSKATSDASVAISKAGFEAKQADAGSTKTGDAASSYANSRSVAVNGSGAAIDAHREQSSSDAKGSSKSSVDGSVAIGKDGFAAKQSEAASVTSGDSSSSHATSHSVAAGNGKIDAAAHRELNVVDGKNSSSASADSAFSADRNAGTAAYTNAAHRTTTEDGKTTDAATNKSAVYGPNGLDASASESNKTTIGDSSSASATKRSVAIHGGATTIADHHETAVVNGKDSRTTSADRSVAIDGKNFEVVNAAASKTTLGDSSSANATSTTVGYKNGEAKAASHQEMAVVDGKDGSASSVDRSLAYKDGTATAQRATSTSEHQGDASRSEQKADSLAISKDQIAGTTSTKREVHNGEAYSTAATEGSWSANKNGSATYAGSTKNVLHEGDTTTTSARSKSASADVEKGVTYVTANEDAKQIGKSSVATKTTRDVALTKGDLHYGTTNTLDVDNDGDKSHQSDAKSIAYKNGTLAGSRTTVASENQGDSSRSEEKSDSFAISKDQVAMQTGRKLEVHGDKDNYSTQSSGGSFSANNNGSVAVSAATANELHEGNRTEKSAREGAFAIDTQKGTVAASKSTAESIQDGDSSMEKKDAQSVKLGLTEGNYGKSSSLVVKNKDASSEKSSAVNAAYGPHGASYNEIKKDAVTEGEKSSSTTVAKGAALDWDKRQLSGSESTEVVKTDGKASMSQKDGRDIVVSTNGGSYVKTNELAVTNDENNESKQSSKTSVSADIANRKFAAGREQSYYEKQGDSSRAKTDAKNIGYDNGTLTYGSKQTLDVEAKDAHHKASDETQISASMKGGKYHRAQVDETEEQGKLKRESHDTDVAVSAGGIHGKQVDKSLSKFGKNSVAKQSEKSVDLDENGFAMANSQETTAANAGGSRTTGSTRKLTANGETGLTHDRGSYEKTTIGDKTTEAARTGHFNVGGPNGAEVGLADSKSTTIKDGDKLTTDEQKRHANVNLHGGDAGITKVRTEKNGDTSSTTTSAVNAGYHDGVAAVDGKYTVGSKDPNGSHDASISGGIKSDGSANANFAVKDVQKTGDTTTTDQRNAGMAIKDGKVSANMGTSHVEETDHSKKTSATNASMASDGTLTLGGSKSDMTKHEDGSTSGTATSGSAHVGPNGAGGEISKMKKNADGSGSAVSAGADVDFKSGSVSAHAGYNLVTKGGTSVHASVSHGTKVYAEVVEIDMKDHKEYEVQYVIAKNNGVSAGASKGPVGGSFGANESDFESGSRHFKDQKQAENFKLNAAEIVHKERPVTSVDGALAIPVGESRGTGHTDGINASGSLALEGASFGAEGHKSSTHELDIKRVTEKWVTVTDTKAGEKGHSFNVSGGPLSNTKDVTNTQFESMTYWFDLTTEDGKRAFQAYTAHQVPPKLGPGVKLGPSSSGKAHEETDKMHIKALGDSKYYQGTSEGHRTDDTGNHDEYEGHQGHDLSPGWIDRNLFGGKEQHSSATLESHKDNGKESYTAVVKLSGKDAKYNRNKMEELFNDTDDKKARDNASTASGDWTLTADISAKTIHEVENNAFAGQKGSTDAKMRAMSKLQSERGLAMAGGLVNVDGKKNAWDVELKGDKNFPGHAGRAALDAERDKDRKTLMEHPEQASAIAASTQKTIDALHARQKAVGDREKYTDLPEPLRQEQLSIIQQHITDFELLHNTAMAKQMSGSESTDAMKARLANKHGYDKMPAADREFAKEHDTIAVNESEAGDLAVKLQAAMPAIGDGRKGLDPVVYGDAIIDYDAATAAIPRLEEEQQAVAAQINALRPMYIEPVTQRAVAAQMAQLITKRLALLKEIQQRLMTAAKAIRPGILDERMKGRSVAWWNQYDTDTAAPMPKMPGANKHHDDKKHV